MQKRFLKVNQFKSTVLDSFDLRNVDLEHHLRLWAVIRIINMEHELEKCLVFKRKITEETYRRWSHVWECRGWEQRWGWRTAACASSCPGRMNRSSPALTTAETEEVSGSPCPGPAPAVPPWPAGGPAPRPVGWRSVDNVTTVTRYSRALTWGKLTDCDPFRV